ncbi:Uncharacterised protein [Mycobacterium tuberculosis]|uniref:Uncharacterized protein n=1 Tax=Mycobacterium tuberculosis TaxID=1773 RepID=A0A0U0QT26_MYCTX|nr:Uncharacterised protein [Mycobacterium tuberculosis]CFR99830.1 Uncharacterised protein [Mycobacterium tuberculosis]CKS50950.1 Uncharacterised protein [Mycobacterium tuberculosis]CNM07059.1 Uncharacterised protein [Mycobacterium tuberculosis]CNM12504.1 Uncharacterised protein [Mycobacterium tuberculosis]
MGWGSSHGARCTTIRPTLSRRCSLRNSTSRSSRIVHDTQPWANSKASSVVINSPRLSVAVIRRTTWPSNRCSTTTVPVRRNKAPVTSSV